MTIDVNTFLCAVIGNPVAHSLSPAIHNAAFSALSLNGVYLAFCVQDVGACLSGMRALPNFRGLSVTIPHKESVMPYLDEIDNLARRVGCVNTVIQREGRLLGTNTDGMGTLRAFEEAGVELKGRRILFAGAGGAVRSVAFAMAGHAQPSKITILGRSRERLESLIRDLRAGTDVLIESGVLADTADALREHDVLVQGTPVGMFGHDEGSSCVPAGSLRPELAVFDMVYRPLKTRLILDAEAAGCVTILGSEMLVNQAALQLEAWTGAAAPRDVMRRALLEALGVSA